MDNWSIVEQKEWYYEEHMLQTYSEEERQEHMINKDHADLILNPTYVNYYPKLAREKNLNLIEWLLYGYIYWWLKWTDRRLWISNENIWNIFGVWEQHISNSIKMLKEKGLIEVSYRITKTWKLRIITLSHYNNNYTPTITKVIYNNIIYIKEKTELLNLWLDDIYKNELYIIWKWIDLWIKFQLDKQYIIDLCIRVKQMLSEYIPRKEDGRIDWNLAKSYTNSWYDYRENPPKWKKKPTNFKTSLRNNIEMRSKSFRK